MTESRERPSKRRKKHHESSHDALTSADQIQQLLEFRQSAEDAVIANVGTFRKHLVAISNLDHTSPEKAEQLQVLLEYSQWQKSASDDHVDFYDLLSTWSFAVEQNAAEPLLAAVPAALAQYLDTISGSLELRPFGLALVDSLLRRDQSKLFGKGLSSPKTKQHLAAPCLRLLAQMAAFDGGIRANDIWMRRDLFIHKSDILLEHKPSTTGEQAEATSQDEALRPLAVELFLTLLKYLDSTAKTEMLNQGRALHGLLQGLSQDSQHAILKVLTAIEAALISDDDVARASLQRFFNSTHLEAIAALYSLEAEEDSVDIKDSVREAAHNVLQKLCTTSKGVLLPQQGWYPPSATASTLSNTEDDYIDLGLEALTFIDDYITSVPVRNVTLSNFIQKLKSQQDILQSSLLSDILTAAPELVANYFSTRKQIPSPNSDDAAWRGSISFLFSVIECPVPQPLRSCDKKPANPPPTTIVIESIIPRPLDRAYLQKLFSSDDNLLRISGARLLTTVLTKLDQVLASFSTRLTENVYLWGQARNRLLELVQSKILVVRDITLALQHTSSGDVDIYTAMLECLATYYKILPHVSSSATFDISPVMTELCSKMEDTDLDSDARQKVIAQLQHCVEIAELTSSTKWLQKADNDSLSPLGQLLKVTHVAEAEANVEDITKTIIGVILHRGILNNSISFFAMSNSLKQKKEFKKFSPTDELFLFLDNSITRVNQKPVKYLDEVEYAQQLLSDRKPLSLLAASIAEQWTFAVKKYEGKKSIIKNIALFVAQFFASLDKVGENYRVLRQLKDDMLNSCEGKVRVYLTEAFEKVDRQSIPTLSDVESSEVREGGDHDMQDTNEAVQQAPTSSSNFDNILRGQIEIPISLEGLDKWPNSIDIELEIRSDRLSRLIFGVSSPDEEIRLQSVQLLHSITHTVDTLDAVSLSN